MQTLSVPSTPEQGIVHFEERTPGDLLYSPLHLPEVSGEESLEPLNNFEEELFEYRHSARNTPKSHAKPPRDDEGDGGHVRGEDVSEYALALSRSWFNCLGRLEGRYQDLSETERHHISRAAIYIELSLNPKEKYSEVPNRPYAIEIHWILHNTLRLKQFLMVCLLLLGFFEVPSWCYDSSDCGDPRVVPQSGIPQFTIGAGLLMEFLILITLLIFLSLNFWTLRFTSWKSSVVEVVLIVVSILDVLISSFVTRNIRLSPFLRPLIFISISTTVRNSLKSIFYGTRAILHLLFLLFFWIFFMASIATVLFKHTSSFATLKEAFLQLIILITTANFPDVAIGALKESIFSIFFFAIFVSLGIWFLMNIVLATIYSSYKTRLEKEQSNEKNKQIYCLKKAFLELHSIRKTGFINYREMMALFRELNVYVHIPSIYTDHQKFILSTMDTKKNGHISGFEFLKLVDLMHIRLREQKSLSFLQILFPSFTTSKFYLLISRMVNHRSFGRVVDLIQAINLVLIGVEWIIHSSQLVFVDNTILIVIFNLEVIMKMLAIGGFTEYINKGRNIYIFLITVSSNVVFCSPDYFDDEIMLLQMLRLSRIFILFLHFPSYNTLASTFQSLLPQLLNLVYVVFMIDYLFCLIGIALYGGEMNMNNHKLNGTLFLASEYTVLNFNDLFSGYVTLFTLRVVNNWYIIMEGYVSISHELSRVYFIGYWLIGAVIILSVVVSSILEKFLSELEHRENHSHRKVNRQLFPPERSWDEIAQNLK